MVYHVIGIETKQLLSLHADEIHDMDYDHAGRVIVYGNDGQAYYLLADAAILTD